LSGEIKKGKKMNKIITNEDRAEIYNYLASKINLPPMVQELTIKFTTDGAIEVTAVFIATKKEDEDEQL
jgi:hypothetical protein